jgi:hypothetical protein
MRDYFVLSTTNEGKKKACVGYTPADAQARQPSIGYVREKFNTALDRVWGLVGQFKIAKEWSVDLYTMESKNGIAKRIRVECVG